jgi:hypothetical protein
MQGSHRIGGNCRHARVVPRGVLTGEAGRPPQGGRRGAGGEWQREEAVHRGPQLGTPPPWAQLPVTVPPVVRHVRLTVPKK